MKTLIFNFKNDAVWQWTYHLLMIGLGLIGGIIVWLFAKN
jgi:hypothetical protein